MPDNKYTITFFKFLLIDTNQRIAYWRLDYDDNGQQESLYFSSYNNAREWIINFYAK